MRPWEPSFLNKGFHCSEQWTPHKKGKAERDWQLVTDRRREGRETEKHSNCWLIRSYSHLLNTNPLSRKHFSSYSRCYTWHYTPINTLPLAAPLPTNEYIAVQECSNWVGAVKLQLTVKIFFWRYECNVWCLDKEIKSLYWQLSTIGKRMKSAMDPFCIEVTIRVYFQSGVFLLIWIRNLEGLHPGV